MSDEEGQSYLSLLSQSIRNHYAILKNSVWFILLLVLGKDYYRYFGELPGHVVLQVVLIVIETLVILFFFGCTLLVAQSVIDKKPKKSFKEVIKVLSPRFLKTVAVLLCYIVFAVALYSVAALFAKTHSPVLSFLVFLAFPVLLFYVLSIFTIPIIILKDSPLLSAFKESVSIVGIYNWPRAASLYGFALVTWLLVSPDTLHGHIIAKYYLSIPFDFVVFCLLLPLLNAMVVYLYRDLIARS